MVPENGQKPTKIRNCWTRFDIKDDYIVQMPKEIVAAIPCRYCATEFFGEPAAAVNHLTKLANLIV